MEEIDGETEKKEFKREGKRESDRRGKTKVP